MSESADNRTELQNIDAASVATFLKQQPDFFNEFPELLRELKIPHPSGEAVSLFDRQLASLREENRTLRASQQDMIENARANEALIKRIHGLVLQLMEAAGPRAIFATLNEQLKQHFNADRVAVLVFGGPSFVEADGPQEFIGMQDARATTFAEFVDNGQAQ
ncbi:MAG: DUF484 family protein, partial [Gammaproteobacteria bacterium]